MFPDGGIPIRISTQTMYRLIALLFLGLGLWSFAFQAGLSALPGDLDLSEVSWPIRIDGVTFESEDQVRFQAEGFTVGSRLRFEPVTPESGYQADEVILTAAHSRPYLLVTLLSGLIFWTVAALVFAPRIDQPAVKLFFWITILYGTGILVGGIYGQSPPLGISLLRSLLQLASLAFLPAAFLHLSLAFPADASLLTRRPRLPVLLYLVAAAVVAWQATMFLAYYRNPGPVTWAGLGPPQAVADSLLVLQVVAGFSVLVYRAPRLGNARQRRQIRWLILGFLVGSAPYVFLRTLPSLFGFPALLPVHIERVLELAIPAGFVLAVVRYRFLDIDIILRRGLIYGFLASGLVVLVVIPVLLLGPGWSDPWPGWWRLAVILCGFVAGILFRPLHQLIGRGVDRAFFKIEREVEDALGHLQADLDVATDQQDLTEILQRRVEDTLHVQRCVVVIPDGADFTTAGRCDFADAGRWLREFTFSTDRGDSLPEPLVHAGFVVVEPLVRDDAYQGAVFLAPKSTGRLFIPDDLDFLRRGADLAGRRLEQIKLARTVAGEKLKRRQLNELSRLKDDFLSRVAHDLRTPVTSLGWSIRNLTDGLAGDLNEKQKEYMSSIRDAVDHLASLVTNLLEISRLEKSKVEVACAPLEVARSVQRAVGTVKPLAEARDVKLAMNLADTGLTRANDDKLTEVLVNLLENAIRYSPVGGTVTAATETAGTGRTRLTVRDQGPGLGGLTDPFARFVQGAPSPGGERGGYGLGLTIAQEYVVLMGGTIHGADHPAGGAVFTIELNGSDSQEGDPS